MSYKSAFFIVISAVIISYFAKDFVSVSDVTAQTEKIWKYINNMMKGGEKIEHDKETTPETATGNKQDKKERLFTKTELWSHYRGREGDKGLHIAIMGRVYDVAKGARHYGPGGGYEFFAGRDGTKAYSTGEFNDAGLTDILDNVPIEGYGEYENWVQFFDKDYTYVGKVVGNFYDENGSETEALKKAHGFMEEARRQKAKEEEHKRIFPRCNSEWTREKGSRVWCTKKSGGVDRDWVGVPRLLHPAGAKTAFCVCVRNKGSATLGHSSAGDDRGDLDYPYLKEYEKCSATSESCKVKSK